MGALTEKSYRLDGNQEHFVVFCFVLSRVSTLSSFSSFGGFLGFSEWSLSPELKTEYAFISINPAQHDLVNATLSVNLSSVCFQRALNGNSSG